MMSTMTITRFWSKVSHRCPMIMLGTSPLHPVQLPIIRAASPKTPSAHPQATLFERQVSLDTFSDTHHSGITLKVKHPDFKFRKNNKTI